VTIRPVKGSNVIRCGQIRYPGARPDCQVGEVVLIRREDELIIAMLFKVSRDITRLLNKPEEQRDCLERDMIDAHVEALFQGGYTSPLALWIQVHLMGGDYDWTGDDLPDEQIEGYWNEAHGYCTFEEHGTMRFLAIYPEEGNLDGGEIARKLALYVRECPSPPLIDFDAFVMDGAYKLPPMEMAS
jgi:hypothetical protein